MSNCGQACPYNTLNGCKVKEYGLICPMSNMASQKKPQTNADRIRAMSDEELAHWICKKMTSCSSNVCPGADLCQSGDGLANGLVKWRKQPVDVDNKHKLFPNGD